MSSTEIGSAVEIRFPETIYCVDAIKRAAYSLSDKLLAEIAAPVDGSVTCTLRAKRGSDLAAVADDFRTAVLDYDLRLRVAKETEATRNLILALAFSKTGVQE